MSATQLLHNFGVLARMLLCVSLVVLLITQSLHCISRFAIGRLQSLYLGR